MPRGCRFALFAFAASCSLAFAQISDAPKDQPHFNRVTVGFSRHVRADCWAPASVSIRNPGPDTDAVVSIVAEEEDGTRQPMVMRARVRLPAHADRRETLYVRVTPSARVAFELYQDNRRTHRYFVQPLLIGQRESLVLCLAASTQNFACQQDSSRQGLSGTLRFENGVQFRDLPDRWEGYGSADVIIVGPLPPEGLTAMQERAIVDWVRAGGLLIFCPGGLPSRYEGTVFTEILPVRILGRRLVEDLPPLDGIYGKFRPEHGRIGLSEATVTGGTVHLQMGQLPLIVSRHEGNGLVLFVAFDLAAERLTSWPELGRLYRDLLARRGSVPQERNTRLPSQAARVLHEKVGVRVLPRSALAWSLGLNVALVVVALVAARKYRVRAFTGLVIAAPLVALIINTVGSRVSGLVETTVASFQFIHSASGRPQASVAAYYALISPQAARCDMLFPQAPTAFPESLVVPVLGEGGRRTAADTAQESYAFDDADLKALLGVHIQPRAPTTFQASYLTALPGVVEVHATLGSQGISFRIVNNSGVVLEQGFVAANRNAAALDDLAPGKTVEVLLDARTARGLMANFSRSHLKTTPEAQQDRLLNALYQPYRTNDLADTGMAAFGWFNGQGTPLSVRSSDLPEAPRGKHRALWIVRAEERLEENSTRFLLPRGSLPMQFSGGDSGLLQEGQWQPFGGVGHLEVDFVVPALLRGLKATRIAGFLRVGQSPAQAAVEAFNWKTGAYDVIVGRPHAEGAAREPDTVPLEAANFAFPTPANYLSEEAGKVRLRVTLLAVPGAGATSRRPVVEDFDLEVEGTRE